MPNQPREGTLLQRYRTSVLTFAKERTFKLGKDQILFPTGTAVLSVLFGFYLGIFSSVVGAVLTVLCSSFVGFGLLYVFNLLRAPYSLGADYLQTIEDLKLRLGEATGTRNIPISERLKEAEVVFSTLNEKQKIILKQLVISRGAPEGFLYEYCEARGMPWNADEMGSLNHATRFLMRDHQGQWSIKPEYIEFLEQRLLLGGI